eukprot:CAMPEP_0117420682 /NCGR_PEP_ID=MMETSP0758-20121206/1959_1 /TAXON_ID=63605 /ORGANISM="Percolomonas cosmopolitus, Strain AE-1 (ATCC 50343)" /LENGTH=324 /DNA_ID=CAMNT_0005202421 /DNA_START=684 /DNA_END=1658 /DNA_ORIENTATION=+
MTDNNLKAIEMNENELTKLKLLNLMNNEFDNFDEIHNLATLKALNVLNLTNNNIKKVTKGKLHQVQNLDLNQNPIESLETIDGIAAQFQELVHLRTQQTPLEDKYGRVNTRCHIIARIGTLAYLNGSVIREKERKDSETFYIKEVAKEYIKEDLSDGAVKEKLQKAHPRYELLCSKHGDPMEIVKREMENTAHASHLSVAHVLIQNMSASTLGNNTYRHPKKLSLSLKVGQLKRICYKLFKLEPELQALYYTPDMEDLFPEALDDDDKEIRYYGVSNNGVILVQERDLDKEKQEAEEKKKEKEDIAKQQEDEMKQKMSWNATMI